MRDYKVGDWVIYIDKENSNEWKEEFGISLYKKIAKIIEIGNYAYLTEFKDPIGNTPYDGEGKGKIGHCRWSSKRRVKLAIDHLKFKKWIKG